MINCTICDTKIFDDDYEKCGLCKEPVHRQCSIDHIELDRICTSCEDKYTCPNCGQVLKSFSGNEGIPAGLYCPECNDAIYDEGIKVATLI